MPTLTLTRDPKQLTPAVCTLGVLYVGKLVLQTIERPWLPDPEGLCGRPGLSCIAPGTYNLTPRFTEARGKHWILSCHALGVYCYPSQVPANCYGRSLVLIHAANWAHELMGCIAPGMRRQLDDQAQWMVTNSQLAMGALRGALVGVESATLVIQ